MPKTNAKVQDVARALQQVDTHITAISDSRVKLGTLLKSAMAAKTFADFDKTSTKTFLVVKEVEKEVKELPPLVNSLKSEIVDLTKLVADKGKSLTYKMQLAASKSKTIAFKDVVQYTKDAATVRDQAVQIAAVLGKEELGDKFYKLRNDLKAADAKKFSADAPKQIKKLLDDLAKTGAAAIASQTVIASGKRLSADPELDDDE